MNVDLNSYKDFVEAVTSDASNNSLALASRVQELEIETGNNVSLLLTAAIGLSSEGGEFSEIVKKCVFQGKPLSDETHFHMKRELGDIIFYWMNACRALNLDPNEVIAENVRKLESRYPNGFTIARSENRAKGDL